MRQPTELERCVAEAIEAKGYVHKSVCCELARAAIQAMLTAHDAVMKNTPDPDGWDGTGPGGA